MSIVSIDKKLTNYSRLKNNNTKLTKQLMSQTVKGDITTS